MRKLRERLQAACVDALHIRQQIFKLCEVALGNVFIQHINERLVFLIELCGSADRVYKLLYLLRIAVKHLHHFAEV